MSNEFLNIIIPDSFDGFGNRAVPGSLVKGYFDPHFRSDSVPEFSGIGFGIMPTIFLEHKRTANVVGESHEGFFDFSIKWENLVLFGFGGWSYFI